MGASLRHRGPGDAGLCAWAYRPRISVIKVMMFFAERGHYVMMPVLLTLVALGITLFFLQTSALALFIYTLF